MIMRVPLFNLSEAGRGYLAPVSYPRLRSLRSLSLGLLRIKPPRGFRWQRITKDMTSPSRKDREDSAKALLLHE